MRYTARDDRDAHVDDLPHQPHDDTVEHVAERNAEEPSGACKRDPLGREDAPDLARTTMQRRVPISRPRSAHAFAMPTRPF
jgi:hypothetical protein